MDSFLIAGRNVSLEPILEALMRMGGGTERPIMDQTGLKGNFDFRLEYAPPPGHRGYYALLNPTAQAAEFQGATLPEALKEQLGMRLEATKAPFPVLVIDHVEKPSEN